jgi:hypothetical protein
MTSKQVFEYALVELNKKEAPSLLLEDYNYFINKAINQYINKEYNFYDVNQQRTDGLRVLKSTAVLTPSQVEVTNPISSALLSNAYEVDLPDDYLHILNCIVEYDVLANYKCYNTGTKWQQGAKRLTADMYSQIINNYYLRPTYKNPYYYINNVSATNVYPTTDNQTDIDYPLTGEVGTPSENVERVAPNRYGNKSKVRMEIRYGKDNTIFQLSKIYIDYIKAPQFIRLTQDQIDEVEDNSQVLEFPDYVCQEIVNELIKLLMENGSDPRLQTHIPINQSIASPAQEQQKR